MKYFCCTEGSHTTITARFTTYFVYYTKQKQICAHVSLPQVAERRALRVELRVDAELGAAAGPLHRAGCGQGRAALRGQGGRRVGPSGREEDLLAGQGGGNGGGKREGVLVPELSVTWIRPSLFNMASICRPSCV